MSKFVKDLMTDDLRNRWSGVGEAVVVDIMGLEANKNVALRKRLRAQRINLLMVKRSLARRAAEGTPLAAAFDGPDGSLAVLWGGDDVVSLAKEVVKISEGDEFKPFTTKGGVLDGASLSPEEVKQVSKWPSRGELISIVAGQIMSVPSQIASQLVGPATDIAAQVKTLIERLEEPESGAEAPSE